MTHHTPGPYYVIENNAAGGRNIGIKHNGRLIGIAHTGAVRAPMILQGRAPIEEDEAQANAALIAAAPDMLAALEKVSEFIRREYVCLDPEEGRYIDKVAEPIWVILCEATTKAKGGAA
jgi:hypothetical protein